MLTIFALSIGIVSVNSGICNPPPIPRGCNVNNGECWVKLATVVRNVSTNGNPPSYITEKYYIGEPYPTQRDAINGALNVLQHGTCTDRIHILRVESFEVLLDDGTIPSFPGFDDCYGIDN